MKANFNQMMREALEKFIAVDLSGLKFPLDGDSSAIYNSDKKEITIPYWRVAELLNEVKAAQDMAKSVLPTPPRNYDLLCWEMHKRHLPKRKGNAMKMIKDFMREMGVFKMETTTDSAAKMCETDGWLNQLVSLINGEIAHYMSQGADCFSVDCGPWHIKYDKAKGEAE